MDGEADQGPATEEADDGGGEDDAGDGEEDSGGDGDGQRQDDLQQVEDAGGDGAGAVQHQGGEELQAGVLVELAMVKPERSIEIGVLHIFSHPKI